MRSACLLAVLAGAVCLNVSQAASKSPASEPFAYCVKATAITNCTAEAVNGDWLVVYSTDIRYRKGTSYWGGDFPYDFCDEFNLNSGCMGLGYSITPVDKSKIVGYTYSFNAFTETWTIEQFTNSIVTIPGTSYMGFRTTYNHYVQVEEKAIFNGQTVQACGSKVVRSGPIYRSANYVILANAPDYSWAVLLYCDNFYGFIDNVPMLQVVVKRDIIDKVSYPFNTLFFYKEIRSAILKNNLNIYGADFNLVYHDQAGMYPTNVAWESIQWEADCMCTSGNAAVAA
uniref:Uncharacterized protein n=1 Tax=Cacopsylla melanoneura TaxID=428564 RepID=A0A8D8XMN0_9HEMI